MAASRRQRWHRIGIQVLLGFSAGLPLLLTRRTMGTWFGEVGVDKQDAFLFFLVALPYNLKVLWAPVLDRVSLPWLDRRRDWMLTSQLLLMVAIFALGTMDPRTMLGYMAVACLCVAVFGASQDIVVDAMRTDLMEPDERGRATGLYVAGYRVAMIAAGAGVLIIADRLSWRAGYWAMAGLLSVGVVSTLITPPLKSQVRPRTMREAFVEPLREMARRHRAGVILSFVLLYKVGDTISMPMVSYFLPASDGAGFSLTEIAVVEKGVGMVAAIAGAIIGGFWTDRIRPKTALLLFGIAQAMANLGYVALAAYEPSSAGLVAAVVTDQICNGLGTAAFVAYLMGLCHKRFSATQYALFTSASTLIGHTLGAAAGVFIDATGWAWAFVATVALALPALALIPWLPDPRIRPAEE